MSDENTPEPTGGKTAGLAKRATNKLSTVRQRTASASGGARLFPAPNVDRDTRVARFLEANDPSPDINVGAASVDHDALLIAGLLVSEVVAQRTTDVDRRARMDNVIIRRHDQLIERAGESFSPRAVLEMMSAGWNEAARLVLLIEISTTDPFSPFELKHSSADLAAGVAAAGAAIGASAEQLAEVSATLKEAKGSHRSKVLSSVGVWGVGGALLLGTLGFAAAPALGAALGSAAGLSGAAATSFGLSTLGGGSLAAGGLGMTGGLWMVTGTAAATGLVGSGGGALLYSLGGQQFRAEIVKLQATYKLVILRSQADQAVAQAVIEDLYRDAEFLRERVAEERELNDINSNRVKELESKIESIEEALGWMEELGTESDG